MPVHDGARGVDGGRGAYIERDRRPLVRDGRNIFKRQRVSVERDHQMTLEYFGCEHAANLLRSVSHATE